MTYHVQRTGANSVIVSHEVDFSEFKYEDWLHVRMELTNLYWQLVSMGLVPEEYLYSIEMEFPDTPTS